MSGNTPVRVNLPLASLVTAVTLVAIAVVALILVKPGAETTPVLISIVGLIVSTVPSLIAAAYSERTSRDIRNGVVEAKMKTAARQALEEHQVLTRDGPFVGASTQALLDLLAQRHGSEPVASSTAKLTPFAPPDTPGVD